MPPSFLNDKAQGPTRFKITYCHSCGYRQRAVKVAAELEERLQESTSFVEGSNGIFEVEDTQKKVVLFSYADHKRFPRAGEIGDIAAATDSGVPPEQAQEKHSASPAPTQSFEDWFIRAYGKPKKPFTLD